MTQYFKFSLCFLTSLFFYFQISNAQQIGNKIEDFSLLEVTQQQKVRLYDNNSACIVLVFISSDCSYDKMYKTKLQRIRSKYANEGVSFICLNSNDDENLSAMQSQAQDWGFSYLKDEKHLIADLLSVEKTPEVVVLQNNAGSFFIKYKGAIDVLGSGADAAGQLSYLEEAIEAVLSKSIVNTPLRPVTGCAIYRGE